MMDYGDRQKRAEMLVKAFRAHGTQEYERDGRTYTYNELADEIEKMTLLGRTFVAVGGLMLRALAAPLFFGSERESEPGVE